MNKKGFTLAEIVVTLGILGVLASVLAPQLTRLMPDKNKVKMLKCYKLLTELTAEMLDDTGLYNTVNSNCEGLNCTARPLRPIDGYDINQMVGADKYRMVLCSKMFLDGGCGVPFTTIDGMVWTVDGRDVTVDVNGDNPPNCASNACRRPDRFRFQVSANGVVTGRDDLTNRYIQNLDRLFMEEVDINEREQAQ